MRRAPALALALLFGVACQVPSGASATAAPTGAQQGGILRVALPAEVTAFDPWNADPASLIATRQIFETLVEVDPATSRITPGLASSWQMTNDGASWTFSLREGVLFHDGAPLDASSVIASFERGRTARASSYLTLFDDPSAIKSVQAVDPRTVRFDLRAPFGPFLAHLASPQAAIVHANGAGTGPFTAAASALAPDGTLTLGRNDFYWRRDSSGKQLPYLDGLVLRPVRDATSRLAELRAGRADVALDLPIAQASSARSDPSLLVSPRKDAALASLGFDVTMAPFDRPEVRRAVAMAVNRSALSAVYAGTSRPANQVVPPGSFGYEPLAPAYHGFTFTNWAIIDTSQYGPSGYTNGLVSGTNVAWKSAMNAAIIFFSTAIQSGCSFRHGMSVRLPPPACKKASRPRRPISSKVSRQSETKAGQITSKLFTPWRASRTSSKSVYGFNHGSLPRRD